MEGLYNNITVTEAAALQKELRDKVVLQKKENFGINTVAGADISFNKYETTVYAGIMVLAFPSQTLKQLALVVVFVTIICAGCVTTAVVPAVQPVAPVTVSV